MTDPGLGACFATGATDGGFPDSASVIGTSFVGAFSGSSSECPRGRNVDPTASTEPKVTTAVATVALFIQEPFRPRSGFGRGGGTTFRTVQALSRPRSSATVMTCGGPTRGFLRRAVRSSIMRGLRGLGPISRDPWGQRLLPGPSAPPATSLGHSGVLTQTCNYT
jgi:hypothetical protein